MNENFLSKHMTNLIDKSKCLLVISIFIFGAAVRTLGSFTHITDFIKERNVLLEDGKGV